jgi:lipopolysaccharide/colanic/teichoic acid biosynthesis glycosyltransferase
MSSERSSGSSPVTYAYLRSDGTAYVVWGSAVAGIAAYAYQLMGGRVLGAEDFAPVSVLLTIHFLTFIVIMLPIEQYVVRRLTIDPSRSGLPRSVYTLAATTVLIATIIALIGADDFLNGDRRFVVFTLLTVSTHFIFADARGHLAGQRRFRSYGLASGAASLLRLVVAIGVTIVRPSASGFALALIVGPLIVLLWRPFTSGGAAPDSPPGDIVAAAPADQSAGSGEGLLGGLVLAAAASQALLLAGPILVGALGGSEVEVSVAFAAFTLGRAPLVFGYNLLARVLPPFTRMAIAGETKELVSWARGLAFAGAALSVVAGALGWWLGPWVVRVAFGEDFIAGNLETSLIAAGVVFAGAGLFVGQILVAGARTGRLAFAWFAGLIGAGAALLIGSAIPVIGRVTLAFVAGEAVALAALVWGAVASLRGDEAATPSFAYDLGKRTLDIAASVTLLILLAPVMILVGLAVRLDSPGPIFFRQERVGRNGRTFELIKVRTMEADNDEQVFAEHLAALEASLHEGGDKTVGIENDDRTTRVGRALRKSSLDEVPNLWNVLRGPLSLVGPRPLVPAEAAIIGMDHARFTVKPGITGLAQVNGRDTISLVERTRLDERYVETRSLKSDLGILIKTVGTVVGIRSDGDGGDDESRGPGQEREYAPGEE